MSIVSMVLQTPEFQKLKALADGCRGSEGKITLTRHLYFWLMDAHAGRQVGGRQEVPDVIEVDCEQLCEAVDELIIEHSDIDPSEMVEEEPEDDPEMSEDEKIKLILRTNVLNANVLEELESQFESAQALKQHILDGGKITDVNGIGEKTETKIRDALSQL